MKTKSTNANQSKNEIGTKELMIWMLPAIILPMISGDIGGETPEIVLSMILGGLGATIGFVLYWLTKKKSNSIKYGAYGLMIVGLIGTILFLTNRDEIVNGKLITCQICGYKAIEYMGDECDVCVTPINDRFKVEEGYSSIQELIKEEQLFFFSMEEDVTFNEPKVYKDVDNEFLKDNNWNPLVTEQEVDIRRKEMEELDK